MNEAKTDFSDAMWRLLENKDFDAISVVDIVRVSGHSHASFYRNFEDKYELMLFSCEELLRSAVSRGIRDSTPEAVVEPFLIIAVNNKRKFLHALSSLDERALRRQVIEKLTYYVQLRLESEFSPEHMFNTRDAGLIFSNSVMGIFIDWLSGDVELSFLEMRTILVQWLKRLASMRPQGEKGQEVESLLSGSRVERTVCRMLADTPVDDLRVGKVIEEAGINRAAFYKQYKDKYDVVNRCFERQADERFAMQTQSGRVVILTRDNVTAYLNGLLANRTVVVNAASTMDPNGLRPFAIEYFTRLLTDLASQEGVADVRQIEPTLRMFCFGAIGHVIFWLKGPRQSVDEIFESLKLLFPAELIYGATSNDSSNVTRGETI